MLDTETRLKEAIPAFLKASSKLVSCCRCRPTPRVRHMREGVKRTMLDSSLFGREEGIIFWRTPE